MKHLKQIIALCGACIGLYIGSGFATMQEVMQYEVSYGSLFWVVVLVTAVIYVYTNLSFAANGAREKVSRGGDIYVVYCGGKLGAFFDYFSAFFCYMSFVVMLGGANSTAMQQWGLPNGAGAIILAVLAVATVLGGLEGILKALSFLGPVIIVFLLAIAGVSALAPTMGFQAGAAAVDSGALPMAQIGGGNAFAAGASYGGFVILWFAAFLAEIGAKNKLSRVHAGMLLSSIFIFGVAALCCVALVSNADIVHDADIPALVLANRISPAVGLAFAVVVFVGIYTSAVPLLWTGVRRAAQEGTPQYKAITVAGGAIGCFIACFVPYAPLLNVLYGLNGYLGFAFMAFMVVRDVRTALARRKSPDFG